MIAILLVIGALGLWYLYNKQQYTYWINQGVAQDKPQPFVGNLCRVVFRVAPFSDVLCQLYNKYAGKRYVGVYQFAKPTLLIREPELIKQIGVKDFDHFMDHRQFIKPEDDPLWAKNLFNLTGDRWRHMRATLSPSFTSSKMKAMFHLMSDCGEKYADYYLNHPEATQCLDMKDMLSRYTTDMIGTIAFGVQTNSVQDRNNDFFTMGKQATDFSGFWRSFKAMLVFLNPVFAKLLTFKIIGDDVGHFFTQLVRETMRVREEKNIVRPDMLHLLMEARKGKHFQDEIKSEDDAGFATVEEHLKPVDSGLPREALTDIDITAQALIFFFGGFESVSATMSFMAYELAVNPDVQRRLQEEIDDVNETCGGKLTYEAITNMKYLDMVVSETLRKWPTFVIVDRVCVKPYTLKATLPDEQDINISKDQVIWIPIYALHFDKTYFPKPHLFDPERFNDDNKSQIKPYTYLPFGVGPRNCIGSRFALLETKILIFHLLTKFDLVPTKDLQVPLKLKKGLFNVTPEKRITLHLKRRQTSN